MNGDQHRPIGHQYALAMIDGGAENVRKLASTAGTQLTLDAFLRVHDEEPVPAFLHSALCAMSLPTKRPKDDTLPIIREDGKYALAINPRPVLQNIDGKSVMRSLGVPYGAYPRVALIYLLSQAVMKRSRDVYLGRNFTEWMRRLGYQTVSYGPRGTANLMREQVDRLLACEWQIRWDGTETDDNAFAVRDVKIDPQVVGDHHYALAQQVRETIAHYRELQDIISLLGIEELGREDRLIVGRARRLQRFLTQPFMVTQAFTGQAGRSVGLADTLKGVAAILAGATDDWPESAFYMVGDIEEARSRVGQGA